MLGYTPQVILAGRRINDSMGIYIAQQTVKQLIIAGHDVAKSRVSVFGLTFKENCPDLCNSKVIDIIHELQSYGISVQVCDPVADPHDATAVYAITLTPINELLPANGIILAVAHNQFKQFGPTDSQRLVKTKSVVMDVKGICNQSTCAAAGLLLWRL